MFDKYLNSIVGLTLVVLGLCAADGNLAEVIVGGGLGILTGGVAYNLGKTTDTTDTTGS